MRSHATKRPSVRLARENAEVLSRAPRGQNKDRTEAIAFGTKWAEDRFREDPRYAAFTPDMVWIDPAVVPNAQKRETLKDLTCTAAVKRWRALRDQARLSAQKSTSHHATVATAAPHVKAVNEAIYRSHDPEELIAAVRAAKKHVAAMRRLATKIGSGHHDASGAFDPAMYELMNLLVKADEMVRRSKVQRKTGRFPQPSARTAWKLS